MLTIVPIETISFIFISLSVDSCFFTFVKGLDRAMSEILPGSEHRYCVQHMYRNFKKKHPGKALKFKMWSIATSTSMEEFNKAMEDMKDFDCETFKWVEKAPHARHWCKAFFPVHTKCDMLVNNICETFNAFILEARDKPIISMLEQIREKLMQRIQQRREGISKWTELVGPLIKELIEDRIKHACLWEPIWNGLYGYQVKGPRAVQYAVDFRKNTNTCQL